MDFKLIIPYSLQGFGLALAFANYYLIGSILVIVGFLMRRYFLKK